MDHFVVLCSDVKYIHTQSSILEYSNIMYYFILANYNIKDCLRDYVSVTWPSGHFSAVSSCELLVFFINVGPALILTSADTCKVYWVSSER